MACYYVLLSIDWDAVSVVSFSLICVRVCMILVMPFSRNLFTITFLLFMPLMRPSIVTGLVFCSYKYDLEETCFSQLCFFVSSLYRLLP
jgi:hypothetical protein